MRPIYNYEIYHFGIKGMKWGRGKMQTLQESNRKYKSKINSIAKNKSAHISDAEIANFANQSTTKKISKALVSAAIGTLARDFMTGEINNYSKMSTKDIIKKASDISKQATINIVANEALARSVANKYDNNGRRIKGKNSSLLTREQVAKVGIQTAIQVTPLIKTFGYLKLAQMNSKKKAGEAAVNKWNGRILSDKVSDYSNIIPNVNYSVR